MKERTNERTK